VNRWQGRSRESARTKGRRPYERQGHGRRQVGLLIENVQPFSTGRAGDEGRAFPGDSKRTLLLPSSYLHPSDGAAQVLATSPSPSPSPSLAPSLPTPPPPTHTHIHLPSSGKKLPPDRRHLPHPRREFCGGKRRAEGQRVCGCSCIGGTAVAEHGGSAARYGWAADPISLGC
jgi:hypothetical protein